LIDRVRVGEKAGSMRFVLDFPGKDFPRYQIAQKGTALSVTLNPSSKRLAVVEQAEQGQTVAEPPAESGNEGELEQKANSADMTATLEDEVLEYSGHKISLDFKDADIKNVLRLFADISGLNIIVSDNVKGNVTLKLDNIPWDEALDLVLETNNLGKVVTRNIMRIETREQIKRINEEKLQAKKSQEKIEDLVIETVDVSYAKSRDIVKFLKSMKGLLSERGSINAFEQTNKVTIQDIESNISRVVKMIKQQDIPTRQVLIEARVVQSNPSYTKEIGIRWGGFYDTTVRGGAAAGAGGADVALSGAAGLGNVVNLPAPVGDGSGGGINFGYITDSLTLDVQLTALENDEKIKIISNPKVLALDNEEARIKQGVALPYLKLSEEGVTSTEFKDAVLELEVTPHITPESTIKLHVFVTKNQKSAQTGGGGEPGIDIREVETDILVESGKTIVIGGIYEDTKSKSVKKVPLFGDLPLFGRFFRNVRTEDQLSELLVFLTVTVVAEPSVAANAS
jgi:type IV pilus assembly protein PilQ